MQCKFIEFIIIIFVTIKSAFDNLFENSILKKKIFFSNILSHKTAKY